MSLPNSPSLLRAIVLPYALGYFISYLLRNVNAVIAPSLVAELGLSAADLGLLTSAYLVGFALTQLPLGVALDRFGPRRVEAVLLLVAALGCAGFALGHGLIHLTLARGLIGVGVSACLMASFKAFAQAFPVERQASLNATIMIAGGLGALTASTPFSLALPHTGWRGLFVGLAVLAVLAATAVYRTPEKPAEGRHQDVTELLRGIATIFGSRAFWRFAPYAGFMIGGFICLQGLWAVPFLMEAGGRSRDGAAFHLLLLNVTLISGYLLVALRLQKFVARGLTLDRLIIVGGFAMVAVSVTMIFGLGESHLMWALFGFVCASANSVYAAHASRYPVAFAGRANTCLNLAVFIGSFTLQWGFGVVVDLTQAAGMSRADALQAAWLCLLALEFLSMVWLVASARWEQKAA